jgi:transcriptional regulator with XRE-family HTH domain
MITAEQIKAARALLNWKQSDLAAKTGLSLPSINNIERKIGSPRLSTLTTIKNILQSAGIEFIGTNGVQKHTEVFEMHEFTGNDFLTKPYDDLFNCMRSDRDEVLMYGIDDRLYAKHMPSDTLRYYYHQKKTGFSERSLLRDGDMFFLSSPQCYRWIDPKLLGVIPYYVYHDRLVMINWKAKRTILIRSQAIADTFRAQFEFLWKMAKPVPPGGKNKLDDPKYRIQLEKPGKKSGK